MQVAGNLTQGLANLRGSVPEEYQCDIEIVDDQLVVNMTEEQVMVINDPGLTALYLANSPHEYLYEVNSQTTDEATTETEPNENSVYETESGVRVVSNLQPHKRVYGYVRLKIKVGERKSGKPIYRKRPVRVGKDLMTPAEEGYDASIIIHDTDWTVSEPDGTEAPRERKVFHEIYEMYGQNEGKMPRYPSAHNSANEQGEKLPEDDKRGGEGVDLVVKKLSSYA